MNSRQKGIEFEKKAYYFLTTIFDKVEWLSRNSQSTFDFRCIKDGKVLLGDAKFRTKGRPQLKYSQSKADFVVINEPDQPAIIFREHFADRISVSNINLKAIGVSLNTWKELQQIKIDAGYKSLEEVILKLLGEKR